MKKRRVLHQACAFSVAVMLVGVNAVPVVAADNAPAAYTNADETWKGEAWAIITVDSEKGSFEDGTNTNNAGHLEDKLVISRLLFQRMAIHGQDGILQNQTVL